MSDNHEHGHCHCHDGHDHKSAEETIALLSYMSDHNRHHGEDLHEIYHALDGAGKHDAAELVHKAMHLFEDGNALLDKALKLIK